MKIKVVLASIVMALVCMSSLTSCVTKQGAVNQLQYLANDLRDNGEYYTIEDWRDAGKKFTHLRDKMRNYRYTPAERKRIGELEGQCAKYMVQGMKNGAINSVLGVGNEIKGILDGLGISY